MNYSFFIFKIFVPYTYVNAPIVIPRTAPPSMSDGKCTYKYILEKAINIVSGITTQPNFLLVNVIIVVAIHDACV